MARRVVVTGGNGFIGSNFIKLLLNEREYQVVNLDVMTYAGKGKNIEYIGLDKHPLYRFVHGNICDKDLLERLIEERDIIVNFAAESHVDRSLKDNASRPFLRNNGEGTIALLEEAVKKGVEKFVQISTDEVYGGIELEDEGKFDEEARLRPGNSYSASKVASDAQVLSFWNTYKIPIVITRSTNNVGEYQHPEKFIPLMITNFLKGKKIPIYGDGLHERDWIYVEDHCRAILQVMESGINGEIYNIAGRNLKANVDVVINFLSMKGADINEHWKKYIEFVPDRLGHDRKYSIDDTKIRSKLGWKPKIKFEEALERTVRWYEQNQDWWERLLR